MDTGLIGTAALAASLAEIVGADNVLASPAALGPYANDQWWYAVAATAAGRSISNPDVAVKPNTTEQVAEIVRLANRVGVPITPWGGGSGVQGAANADHGGIMLDLKGLNRIREIDHKSLVCVVEAGKVCRNFEAELNAQ